MSESALGNTTFGGAPSATPTPQSPRGLRDNLPPAGDSSAAVKSRRIYVRPRTGPQSAHLWWSAVAKLQAASVPIAEAA